MESSNRSPRNRVAGRADRERRGGTLRRWDSARGAFLRGHGEGGDHVIVRGTGPAVGTSQGSGGPGGGSEDGGPGEARAGPERREGGRPGDGGTAPRRLVRGERQGEVVR